MTLCQETADAYASHGVAVVPTLIGSTTFAQADIALADASVQRFFPAPMLRMVGERMNSDVARATRSNVGAMQAAAGPMLRLLRDSGVTILAGTDFGDVNPWVPGLSLHQEMALLVDAGLTQLEALQAATINAARVLEMADSLGTVEAEKLADLVLLSANPLEDIGNTRQIAAVIADGRLYDRAALDELLAVAEAWAANWQPFL